MGKDGSDFRKGTRSGKVMSPIEFGSKGIGGPGKGAPKPGSDFRKGTRSGEIMSPVDYKGKGMPSAIPVKHNRPAVLD